MQYAVALLNSMGGLAELGEEEGRLIIRGYNCPLSAVVPGHPQVCKLVETMLTRLIGVPVQERCERVAPWRCRFEV